MTDPLGLGRKVEHDPRSRAFQARTAPTTGSVLHRLYGGTLDQGNLGACTGYSSATCLNTAPLKRLPLKTNADGLDFYKWATVADEFPGTYPPDDSGSSGLGAAKGLRAHGVIKSYQHAFGVDHLIGALMIQPVIIGVNWYESMFKTDSKGFLHISGAIAGGHEVTIRGWHMGATLAESWAIGQNQWGQGWGYRGTGRFHLWGPDAKRLLDEQGDVTAFTV